MSKILIYPDDNRPDTTPQEDAELRDEVSHIMGACFGSHDDCWYVDNISDEGLDDNEADQKILNGVVAFIKQHGIQERIDARRIAKEENVRDFSAVVKAFNEALTAGFDAPSVRSLRTVINNADARANYVDLPEQLTALKDKE